MRIHTACCLCLIIAATLAPPASRAQYNTDARNISQKDVLEALQFMGLDIFKFGVDTARGCDLFVVMDEFGEKGAPLGSDTLLRCESSFERRIYDSVRTEVPVDSLRFLTKLDTRTYAWVSLDVSTPGVASWKEVSIRPPYNRKHYWVRFAHSSSQIGKKQPLLFLGSEWDDVVAGVKTTRFCSRLEMNPDLSDPTVKFMPHFYVISYVLQPRQAQ